MTLYHILYSFDTVGGQPTTWTEYMNVDRQEDGRWEALNADEAIAYARDRMGLTRALVQDIYFLAIPQHRFHIRPKSGMRAFR